MRYSSQVTTVWLASLAFVVCAIQVDHNLINPLLLNHRHILRRKTEHIGNDSHWNYTTERERRGKLLTWPTSAGAIVELICSTACETPVLRRLLGLLSCNIMSKSCTVDNKTHAIFLVFKKKTCKMSLLIDEFLIKKQNYSYLTFPQFYSGLVDHAIRTEHALLSIRHAHHNWLAKALSICWCD